MDCGDPRVFYYLGPGSFRVTVHFNGMQPRIEGVSLLVLPRATSKLGKAINVVSAMDSSGANHELPFRKLMSCRLPNVSRRMRQGFIM